MSSSRRWMSRIWSIRKHCRNQFVRQWPSCGVWMFRKGVSVLAKYTLAYFIIKNAELDKSRPPTQDVAHLVTLRNALVHYEP